MIADLIEGAAHLLSAIISGADSNTTCKHCGKIAFLVIVGVVVGVVYFWPVMQTQQLVAEQAKHLCHGVEKKHPFNRLRREMDAWDVTLDYQRVSIEDPISTKCIVTSAGRDQEFGTGDDIIGENVDYHKTKIVSKWLGTKASDAVEGFVDGVTEGLSTSPK